MARPSPWPPVAGIVATMAESPYTPPEASSASPASATRARIARRVALVLVVMQVGLVVVSLAFRALVYPRLGVAPGEPYGLGDVLELFIGALLALASLAALVAACVLASVRSLRDGRAIVALVVSGLTVWPLSLTLRAAL